MSGGWQVGDLALCIDDSPGFRDLPSPCIKGRIYQVEGVYVSPSYAIDAGKVGLFLVGVKVPSKSGAINASRFRKIKPDAEPCEEEFTVLIKRMKPAKVKS